MFLSGGYMAQISLRIDDTLKRDADSLFKQLGMTLSSAVSVFLKQAVNRGGLPFPVVLSDPYYSPANTRWLDESIAQMKRGEVIIKTIDELDAIANENA
jgi:DNA-damage-inducible protein J